MSWSWKRAGSGTGDASSATTVILSVVLGFAAGLVGGLLASIYLVPVDGSAAPTLTIWRNKTAAAEREIAAGPPVFQAAAAVKSAVLLFEAKKQTGTPAEAAYLPSEALAGGLVLTSDGWLLTGGRAIAVFAGRAGAGLAAVVGGRSYTVQKIITDSYSGSIFIKIEASNLPVVSFSDDAASVPGQEVYSFDAALGLRSYRVIGLREASAESGGDLVHSSESLQRILDLEGEDAVPGAAVLSGRGEVLGIMNGTAADPTAVPLESFVGRLSDVLGRQEIVRPFLGVHYLDLSGLVGLTDERGILTKGALLADSADGRTAAVVRRSPAADAGLRAGDIIVSVDGEDVTAKKTLAEIISEYEPGDRVSLGVRRGVFPTGTLAAARNGVLVDLEVVLSAVPARP